MKRSSHTLESPFSIIGSVWTFYQKHPVLNAIAFWFFFAPIASLNVLEGVALNLGSREEAVATLLDDPLMMIIAIPGFVVLLFLVFWGEASTLLVGKRMWSNPAGRNRTSFRAVSRQSRKCIGPLILTEILRTCVTLLLSLGAVVVLLLDQFLPLWALLTLGIIGLLPGILYSVRTTFYGIIIVSETGVKYRKALRKSLAETKGRVWSLLWRMAILALVIFLAAGAADGLIVNILLQVDDRLGMLASVLTSLVDAYAGMFFSLCLVALYASLKDQAALFGGSPPQT